MAKSINPIDLNRNTLLTHPEPEAMPSILPPIEAPQGALSIPTPPAGPTGGIQPFETIRRDTSTSPWDIPKASPLLRNAQTPAPVATGTEQAAPTQLYSDFQLQQPAKSVEKLPETAPSPVFTQAPPKEVPKETVAPAAPTMEGRVPATGKEVVPEAKKIQEFAAVDPATGLEKTFKSQKDMETYMQTQKAKYVAAGFTDLGNALMNQWGMIVMNPEDSVNRIKQTQLNNIITTLGPQNQAAMDSINAYIKQNNLQGTGAGTALLLGLQRATGANMAKIVGSLNEEATQRILELQEKGFQVGLSFRGEAEKQRVQDLRYNSELLAIIEDQAMETGDYTDFAKQYEITTGMKVDPEVLKERWSFDDAFARAGVLKQNGLYSKALEAIKTAVPLGAVDENEYIMMNPARKQLIAAAIAQLDDITEPAARKEFQVSMAEKFPELWGFDPDKGAEAKAWAEKQPLGKLEDMLNTQQQIDTRYRSYGVALHQGKTVPWNTIELNGQLEYRNYEDEQVHNTFDGAYNVSAKTIIDETGKTIAEQVLEDMGYDSIEDITGQLGEDRRRDEIRFMSRAKAYEESQNVISFTEEFANQLLREFMTAVPDGFEYDTVDGKHITSDDIAAWLVDPDMRPETIEWIARVWAGGNYERDADGNISPTAEALIPPWEPNSPLRYRVTSWPKYYDAAGNLLSKDDPAYYEGGEVFGLMATTDAQNANSAIRTERERLIKEYDRYLAGGGKLTRDEWMIATKDGQDLPPDEKLLEAAREKGVIPTPSDTSLADETKKTELIASFRDKASTGKADEMTVEEVTAALLPMSAERLPTGDISGWKKKNEVDAFVVNVEGIPMQVLDGIKYPGDSDVVLVSIVGTDKKFWKNEDGRWFAYEEGKTPYISERLITAIGGSEYKAKMVQEPIAKDMNELKKLLEGTPE